MRAEESIGKTASTMAPVATAEWIWEANGKVEDYHKNMDGVGFERWLENRLIPAFEALFPGKKMILVMDNASYHHQHNTDYFPQGVTPKNATKGQNAQPDLRQPQRPVVPREASALVYRGIRAAVCAGGVASWPVLVTCRFGSPLFLLRIYQEMAP